MCYLLGEFTSLNATTKTTFPTISWTLPDGTQSKFEPRNVAENIAIQGITTSGVTVSFQNAATTDATPDRLEGVISGEEGSLRFSGDSGFLAFSPPKLELYKPAKTSERAGEEGIYDKPQQKASWEEVTGVPTPAFGGIGPVYEAFAKGEEGTWATFEDAVVRHKMVEAIYRSAEKGTMENY